MIAFVQIAVDGGRDREVYHVLKEMKEVTEAYIVFGDWDLLARIELDDAEQLGSFIVANIRSIPGIKNTKTLVVAK